MFKFVVDLNPLQSYIHNKYDYCTKVQGFNFGWSLKYMNAYWKSQILIEI